MERASERAGGASDVIFQPQFFHWSFPSFLQLEENEKIEKKDREREKEKKRKKERKKERKKPFGMLSLFTKCGNYGLIIIGH